MSHTYQAISWNPQKRRYDSVIALGVGLYLALFLSVSTIANPHATVETLLLRAFGTAALLLLHLILLIGPAARLWPRLLPLLYNRRHLGVTTFLLGLAHGGLALVQFHALGDLPPLVSVLVSNTRYTSLADFPFQPLGLLALLLLFLLAATSHDFWLKQLSAPVWKRLHMLVYLAYALLMAHVSLGVLQAETSPWLAGALGAGLLGVVSLQLAAARREQPLDVPLPSPPAAEFVLACRVAEIPENRARIVTLAGERVAIFKYDGQISALSNVCQHQNGPLGEGVIRDGCVTCPWHGFQYLPASGASPAPFTEKVPTFRVQVRDAQVFVDPRPLPPGTAVAPARVGEGGRREAEGAQSQSAGFAGCGGHVLPASASQISEEFYVGYEAQAPPGLARLRRRVSAGVVGLALGVAALLAVQQQRLPLSVFEFQQYREFSGVVQAKPYPALLVAEPEQATLAQYLLVAPGKHRAEVAAFDGQAVSLRGARIYRDGVTMLEILPDSLRRSQSAAQAYPALLELGTFTLRGEIVDSKCYLGVMNPGHTKPHRECAVRCISGGIPPLFIARTAEGNTIQLLLTDPQGTPINQAVLPFVAEPLEITGQVWRQGTQLYLRADPASFRRLP